MALNGGRWASNLSRTPIYRQAVEAADKIFTEIAAGRSCMRCSRVKANRASHKTEYAQPANFMVQIGLLETLRAAGIQPGAVVGHSVGELHLRTQPAHCHCAMH